MIDRWASGFAAGAKMTQRRIRSGTGALAIRSAESVTDVMSFDDSEPLLTSRLEVFIASLEPGDLLLFDSLKSLSGLVQWADAAPVNHVGL